jgi:dihydroorotate dehydrogenase electron transfer subunit
MRMLEAEVVENDVVMPNTRVLRLRAPSLSQAVPGQFLHIRTTDDWDPLLRRPISLFRIFADGASILVRDVGRGSGKISRAPVGSRLDCIGPLGQGFQAVPGANRLLMVGGGYGVAPLVGLAERLLPAGAEVTLLLGAATAAHVFPAVHLPPAIEYHTSTDDGTQGHHGLVTELIPRFLHWADAVYACGPTAMLEAVAAACASRPRLPVAVAMEQQMGCAMGVCLACVIPTKHGNRRVCRDGPVFPASEVVWK